MVAHLLGLLSSRARNLVASYGQDAPGRVEMQGDEVCVYGGLTYAELRTATPFFVPTPSCDRISVLGHLVSDGHGRLAHDEVWMREHVTRVDVGDHGWRATPGHRDVWNWTLAAGRGRVHAACFNRTTWTVPSVRYGLDQTVRLGTPKLRLDGDRDTIVWASRVATVTERRGDSDALPVAWSVRLSSLLADLPGVSAVASLLPTFFSLTPLFRGLVVLSGTVEDLPNPVLAPCTVRAEDAEVRLPWADFVRLDLELDTRWSLIAKRAFDPLWMDDVAIVDVQSTDEALVDEVVERLCASRCVLHLGKSVSPHRAADAFAHYYAGTTPEAPSPCYHPWCTRTGMPTPYVSARGRLAAPWLL